MTADLASLPDWAVGSVVLIVVLAGALTRKRVARLIERRAKAYARVKIAREQRKIASLGVQPDTELRHSAGDDSELVIRRGGSFATPPDEAGGVAVVDATVPGDPPDWDDTAIQPDAPPEHQDPGGVSGTVRDLAPGGVIDAPRQPDYWVTHESGDAVQGAMVEDAAAPTSPEASPATFDFTAFFLTHHDRLVADVARYCANDRALAEDVVQETLLKAYQLREQFAEINNPYRWLWKVATRAAQDVFKSERRRTERENRWEEGRERLNRGVDEWDSHTWMIVVRQLPAPYDEVIRYRFVLRYSRQAIADKMGVSLRTVDHRINEALGILRNGIDLGKED